MRTSVFFILLATAAMPALAAVQSEDRGADRRAARAERSERGSSESGQRWQRTASTEPGESAEGAATVQRAQSSERVRAQRTERSQAIVQSSDQSDRRTSNGYSGRRNRSGSDDRVRLAPVATRDSTESVTNWRTRERRVSGVTSPTNPTTTVSTTRDGGRGDRSGTNWGVRSRDGVTGGSGTRSTSWRDHDRDDHGRRWSSNWRNDHRYNWRSHRSRYSSLYRVGRYYDPFGYGYRRFSIGLSLGSGYYGNNYWLNDPWQYRLPPAYGPYRWIRYYDDALLVNIYDGQVVDVIHNFFW